MDIKSALNRIAQGKDLTGTEMREVMEAIMSGETTPSQIGAFLMGMRVKGETVGEIAAAVSIMRRKMVPVEAPEDAIDIVGTGGTARERSISRPARHWSSRGPACQSPSTATARSPRNRGRPKRCRRWASGSIFRQRKFQTVSPRPGSASCSRPATIRR